MWLTYVLADARDVRVAGKGFSDAEEVFSSLLSQDDGCWPCGGFAPWRGGVRRVGISLFSERRDVEAVLGNHAQLRLGEHRPDYRHCRELEQFQGAHGYKRQRVAAGAWGAGSEGRARHRFG